MKRRTFLGWIAAVIAAPFAPKVAVKAADPVAANESILISGGASRAIYPQSVHIVRMICGPEVKPGMLLYLNEYGITTAKSEGDVAIGMAGNRSGDRIEVVIGTDEFESRVESLSESL